MDKEDLLLEVEEDARDDRPEPSSDGGGEGGDGYFEYA